MAMERLAVNGGSGITARQWHDFWEKVELNKIHRRNFQQFLDNPEKFFDPEQDGLISLSLAKKILGRRKIITVVNFNKIWRDVFPDFPIRYTEEDLREAALRNEQGDDWRLIFYGGGSIAQLRGVFGIDPASQPCFDNNNFDWYLREEEADWAKKGARAGYYLINFRGKFKGFNHDHQEKHLKEQYFELERTSPQIFTEAIFSIFILTGEEIASSWRHWSSVKAANGLFVNVGPLNFGGYKVSVEYPSIANDALRVSICAKQR